MPVAGSDRVNSTVVGVALALFICPSDARPQLHTQNSDVPSDPLSLHNARQGNYLFATAEFSDSGPLYHLLDRHPGQGMFGNNGAASHDQVEDGLSLSIAAGESVHPPDGAVGGPYWGAGVEGCCHGVVGAGGRGRFASRHAGGEQYVFGDGAVKFISLSIDGKVFAALHTIHGGETAAGDL
jgi:hypothetical protein